MPHAVVWPPLFLLIVYNKDLSRKYFKQFFKFTEEGLICGLTVSGQLISMLLRFQFDNNGSYYYDGTWNVSIHLVVSTMIFCVLFVSFSYCEDCYFISALCLTIDFCSNGRTYFTPQKLKLYHISPKIEIFITVNAMAQKHSFLLCFESYCLENLWVC